MKHKKRRNRVMSEVGIETLRTPTHNATGEEVMESDGNTHDDNGIRNSSGRTTSDVVRQPNSDFWTNLVLFHYSLFLY